MELLIRKRAFGRVMVYQEKELITPFKSVQLRKSGENLTYLMVITTYSKKKRGSITITNFIVTRFYTDKNLFRIENKEEQKRQNILAILPNFEEYLS